MLKSKKGFTGVEVTVSIIAIIIFTSTILALMYNVKLENTKIHGRLMANVYLTETLENIGIAKFDDIKSDNQDLIPKDMSEGFKITIEEINLENTSWKKYIKKIRVKISYMIKDKEYEETIERLKVKE